MPNNKKVSYICFILAILFTLPLHSKVQNILVRVNYYMGLEIAYYH